ncbi:hypothetical protein AB0B56_08145 [Streptosporangium canum]|uniref:hypothetical protein n=1 Tax=Streptosporangium canum TaxID=324952 RepID=UPI00343B2DB9
MLRASGAAGSALFIGMALPTPAAAAAEALSPQQREMVLQVAKAGAIYPIEVPSFGEPGTASSRATDSRLREAEARLRPARLTAIRAGADLLISQGLLAVPRPALLAGIGRAAATAAPAELQALIAVAALGAATVSRHLDPASDSPATVWIGGLAHLHDHGMRPTVLRHLETR